MRGMIYYTVDSTIPLQFSKGQQVDIALERPSGRAPESTRLTIKKIDVIIYSTERVVEFLYVIKCQERN